MFTNRYVQRRVASTDSKACFLCYKPTSSVMVHEANADFFFACDSHLTDPGFAVLDAASREAELKKREREEQINDLMKEWTEKSRSRTDIRAAAKSDAEKANVNMSDEDKLKSDKAADAEPALNVPAPVPSRKVYELNKGVLNLRLNAKRQAAQERRTKAMLETPGLFPKTPSHKPH